MIQALGRWGEPELGERRPTDAVLAAFTTALACPRKANRPPGPDALAELARLRGLTALPAPVIDLGRYAALETVAC